MVRGAERPPGWVNGLVCSAYCHSYSENLVDYREGNPGTVVVVGVMVIYMLFHVVVTFGTMMIDVLLHYSFVVMAPFEIAIPVPIMVFMMPITIPTMLMIPVTILPAMRVAVSVWISFALLPSVVMSRMILVLVMVTLVVSVPSFSSVMISPSVAA